MGARPGAAASFQITVAVTGFTLFVLGTVKSTFGDGIWWGRRRVTAIGGLAAMVAYYAQGVDWLVKDRASELGTRGGGESRGPRSAYFRLD